MRVMVPCGQCIGCRLEYSRQWAMRIMHESTLHDSSSFITLTYDDDHLPSDGGLNKPDFTNFMKKLRKQFPETKLRYYQCGEYGEQTLRPHHHAAIFGTDFPDKRYLSNSGDNHLYVSPILQSCWPHGISSVGSLTFESAAYVARYVTKKINGRMIENAKQVWGLSPYNRCDIVTGELYDVQPEYATMSRGGNGADGNQLRGIGHGWYEKYHGDCYPSDYLVVNGHKVKPPKYYDSLYPGIADIKAQRVRSAAENYKNNTPERLRIRETIKRQQLENLKRGL